VRTENETNQSGPGSCRPEFRNRKKRRERKREKSIAPMKAEAEDERGGIGGGERILAFSRVLVYAILAFMQTINYRHAPVPSITNFCFFSCSPSVPSVRRDVMSAIPLAAVREN